MLSPVQCCQPEMCRVGREGGNDDCVVRVEKARGAVEAKVVARDH